MLNFQTSELNAINIENLCFMCEKACGSGVFIPTLSTPNLSTVPHFISTHKNVIIVLVFTNERVSSC